MPLRIFSKSGVGVGNFIDSGLFETERSAWIAAGMASEQTDFAGRPDDVAPTALAKVGELMHAAWS